MKHLSAVVAACAIAATGHPAQADPFAVRDANPLVAGQLLAIRVPARLPPAGAVRADALLTWSSTAVQEQTADEQLIVDAELRELRMTFEGALRDRLAIRLQVPVRAVSGGVLDGFIDAWHDTFGLPEGARRVQPRDRLQLKYIRSGTVLIDRVQSAQGLGDVLLQAGLQLHTSAAMATSTWISVEAPTGKDDGLLGNGDWDADVQFAAQTAVGTRTTAFLQAGVQRQGHHAVDGIAQRRWTASASAAAAYALHPRVDVMAQVDFSSRRVGGDTVLLGSALWLTVGAEVRSRDGWAWRVGVSEDIKVGSTADVSFTLSAARSFADRSSRSAHR